MDKYLLFFSSDNFATHNNIEFLECRPGYARAQVKITDQHLNRAGIVHGGLLFSLADCCFAAATNSYGQISLSINAAISFLEKSDSGIITAEAKEISRNSKLSTCIVHIYNANKEILASFTGTAYITNQPINFQ